jgi:hypothetical protein
MTPLEAYEKSLLKMINVSYWKDGINVDNGLVKDMGTAQLKAYAMNWQVRKEGVVSIC